MSINEIWEKINPSTWLRARSFVFLTILLISCISYGIGRLSLHESQKTPISVKSNENMASVKETGSFKNTNAKSTEVSPKATSTMESKPINSEVVASKTGKKYFWPWCGSVKRIKPENKITFSSSDAAKKAGLTPATNCKGLK